MSPMRHPAMIAAGNFFFRHRNLLFPVFVAFAVVFCSPSFAFGDRAIDLWLDVAGAAIALAGQGLRMLTIGYEYVVRGGRHGRVYAEQLVQGGVFAHSRNPLYLGNLLMIVGLAVMVHSLPLYLAGIPLFVFVYAAGKSIASGPAGRDSGSRPRACGSTGGGSQSGNTAPCSGSRSPSSASAP